MNTELEIKGEWYLPQNEDNCLIGTLYFNNISGARLELHGHFDGGRLSMGYREDDLILGISSESKLVTLYSCFVIKSGLPPLVSGQPSGLHLTEYVVNYVLIGAHIKQIEDLKFNRVSCEIFNLDEWVGISGFQENQFDMDSLKSTSININYTLPEQINFGIDENCKGTFNFIASRPGWSIFEKSKGVTQRVEYIVESDVELNLKECLSYLTTFQNFLVLALYEPTYPISIKLSNDILSEENGNSIKEKRTIELYHRNADRQHQDRVKYGPQLLFDYNSIQGDFESIISKWYLIYHTLETSINLLFEQFYNGNRFTVNTFLNLAQAAESFHTRLHNHPKMDKADYEEMKENILKTAPDKYHGWLKEQFNFGNNLNLHYRLEELTDKYSNTILDKLLGDVETFIKQVKHSRNYYTHYSSEGRKKALTGKRLYHLAERLKALLVCAILEEVGFGKERLTKLLDNVKWSFFNHLASWKD